MGVTGLWTVVAPTARPTQLASLNRKRLAVDASIWIYQFLKAVRDKEGNALRNSHVVGFFRRICKLLYFGIKPVFVFDGGAPILKRETIRKRARRREGRREDAARTAGKLLAVQVARAAEEEEKRRKAVRDTDTRAGDEQEELPDDQELVYVDELGMSARERQAGRGEKFRKKDQYHLPDLDVSIADMGAPNDPRIMSQVELEDYARQFHSGEDVNLYDFSKIDFESPFFLSLPPGDRYNILNAARLRSRLRMGYSKDQLDGMFPDRMAFSKFQIERVKERNELTQRLMGINGMSETDWMMNGGGRIAGEKGKEYILVKNDGVEGGWALGVVSDRKGTKKETAIDLEGEEDEDAGTADEEENEDFEDVAIEGLNRIPKVWAKKRKAADLERDAPFDNAVEEIARKRKAVYEARRAASKIESVRPKGPVPATGETLDVTPDEDDDALFVPEDKPDEDDGADELFEDVLPAGPMEEDADDDLQRAIAMSLEKASDEEGGGGFVPEQPHSVETGNQDDDDEGFDLQTALLESRRSKNVAKTNVRERTPTQKPCLPTPQFDGPLPFESINLGHSLLGKKKSKKIEEDLSGGFDRDLGEDAFRKERPPQPMPDWFNAAPSTKDLKHAPETNKDDEIDQFQRLDTGIKNRIRRQDTKEIIDLEAEDDGKEKYDHVIEIEEDDEEKVPDMTQKSHVTSEPEIPEYDVPAVDEEAENERRKRDEQREKRYEMARQIAAENDTDVMLMNDVAEKVQAEPPQQSDVPHFNPAPETSTVRADTAEAPGSDFEEVYWSDSDDGQPATPGSLGTVDSEKPKYKTAANAKEASAAVEDDDEGEDFEDVQMSTPPVIAPELVPEAPMDDVLDGQLVVDESNSPQPQGTIAEEDFDYLSESEEELMRQLAVEAEEHARFASSLHNQRTSEQAMRDYENELKQLRNQQKKDRRDADEVTQVMVQECQALLRLFGIPYITAPMEAEAQCAELVHLGLVDGIVTDDSDIFLFGGTRIYKNMFNAAKYVECYLASELEKEFLLDRRRLIRFAHLLGSDYTEGIPGVGPVTALEILTEFETLTEFKEWCSRVQLGRPQDLEDQLTTPFRRKFRSTVQKRLFLPPGFPDARVDEAYLNPEVDSDPEAFQWGVPDLDKLRSFLMATIGWSQERTDEILVPVIRDMNKREVEGTQSNITRFFSGGVGVGGRASGVAVSGLAMGGEGPGNAGVEGMAPRNRTGKESGRMRNAFKKLRGEAVKRRKGDEFEEAEPEPEEQLLDGVGDPAFVESELDQEDGGANPRKVPSRPRRGRKATEQENADDPVNDDNDDYGDFAEDEAPRKKKKTTTRTKKR
ncbi:DNA repair protein rad2 [Rhinocladiella similis]